MHVGDLVEQWTVLGEERELIAGMRGATRIYMAPTAPAPAVWRDR